MFAQESVMENPETIEIAGLKTIHKLCKFGADNNMEGCTFTEIVERMFDELAKAQAVPEGFVLVEKTKLMQIVGSAAIIEPITRGNPYMDSVKRELTAITDVVKAIISEAP